MRRLRFGPKTIFRRSIRLMQTDRKCWTIQTNSDELNWARRRTFCDLTKFGSSHEKFDVWLRPKCVKIASPASPLDLDQGNGA